MTISPAGVSDASRLPWRTNTLQAQFVLELPDLLADARLRREERFGGVGDVEAVVDDGDEVAELLEVHSEAERVAYITEGVRD